MTAEPPSLLSPPPTVVRRVRARVLCLGRQVTLGTPLRRIQEHQRRDQAPALRGSYATSAPMWAPPASPVSLMSHVTPLLLHGFRVQFFFFCDPPGGIN